MVALILLIWFAARGVNWLILRVWRLLPLGSSRVGTAGLPVLVLMLAPILVVPIAKLPWCNCDECELLSFAVLCASVLGFLHALCTRHWPEAMRLQMAATAGFWLVLVHLLVVLFAIALAFAAPHGIAEVYVCASSVVMYTVWRLIGVRQPKFGRLAIQETCLLVAAVWILAVAHFPPFVGFHFWAVSGLAAINVLAAIQYLIEQFLEGPHD